MTPWRLLKLWAPGDRIRVSPREGKLLRLRAGACLRIGGKPFKVLRRVECAADSSVTYTCRGVDGDCEITVPQSTRHAPGAVRIVFDPPVPERPRHAERACYYDAADIEIFG